MNLVHAFLINILFPLSLKHYCLGIILLASQPFLFLTIHLHANNEKSPAGYTLQGKFYSCHRTEKK